MKALLSLTALILALSGAAFATGTHSGGHGEDTTETEENSPRSY